MGPAMESGAIRYNGDPLLDAGYFPLILVASGGLGERSEVQCWGGE